jgi:hypothetical protein
METINWSVLTTPDINIKKMTMEREYDSIKLEITKLLSKLSDLDKEYIKANSELKRRNGK